MMALFIEFGTKNVVLEADEQVLILANNRTLVTEMMEEHGLLKK